MKKPNLKFPQGGSKRALHSGLYASVLAAVAPGAISSTTGSKSVPL